LHLERDLVDLCVLTHLLDQLVLSHFFHSNSSRKFFFESQNRFGLAFREYENLQNQMISFVSATVHPPLAHHDKTGKKDRLDGDDCIQQWKGDRIEMVKRGTNIQQYPQSYPHCVNADEPQAADRPTQGIAQALGTGAAMLKILLVASDELDCS
jgi:hypothetical protein